MATPARKDNNSKRAPKIDSGAFLKDNSCEGCGGTGTEVVVHGDTSFSGDDNCNFCSGSGKSDNKAFWAQYRDE